jgi:hypothetical protein
MNAPKMCMLPCWSSSDGEEYFGNQEYFEDQQDQQELLTKASIAWAYLDSYSLYNLLIMHVSNIARL